MTDPSPSAPGLDAIFVRYFGATGEGGRFHADILAWHEARCREYGAIVLAAAVARCAWTDDVIAIREMELPEFPR